MDGEGLEDLAKVLVILALEREMEAGLERYAVAVDVLPEGRTVGGGGEVLPFAWSEIPEGGAH
jgi:hypothetical protein